MALPTGKIPSEILKKTVFSYLGAKREEVILGPSLGEDGALIRIGDKVLVFSMDPITGAVERIGWLAVNVNANDVATFGIYPSFFSSCILLPPSSTDEIVQTICKQIDMAARKLGIAVIGGHTEVTPELNRPIIVGCAIGVTEPGRYVTSNGSKPGDKLILTKGPGIEGTAILAAERYDELKKYLGEDILKSAEKFYSRISVVEEAVLAFKQGGVTAMHDPTEGGVIGGVHELADAANLGVKIFEERISIAPETLRICRFFHIDPLQLISSGALLISAKPDCAEKIVKELIDHNISAVIIGEFLDDPRKRIFVRSNGSAIDLVRPSCDHLWIALEK
ncbi:MAG: AIR synthase family protein [Candidatus Bathyarchaeia archaeon]